MEKERFTMLLLEPGEIFFEDYSVRMKLQDPSNPGANEWMDGRLKLCCKSMVFVSKDINQPLIKVQLRETVKVEKSTTDDSTPGSNILAVDCKQYVEMLKGNHLEPYKFVHRKASFLFSFNYANVDDCLPHIMQLLRAATLPTAEQNAMITAIIHSRQSRVSFDTSWLEDLYEQVVLEVQANKIRPLVVNPGRVLLTNSRIYFQPYNNMDQYPVLKINLKNVKSVLKRRFLLRQVGLEIKWKRPPDNKAECLFLSVKSQKERDTLYKNLMSQPALRLDTIPQNQMTMQWQNGALSNYDYLLYINSLADRTFHDLTQYPVMPWIIRDYSSTTLDLNDRKVYRDLTKPIGALEPNRLERLKERYEEMTENKFLYGSHYSAPGFVLFYLVRKYPQYMLCLQNGRFDHPDRMFNKYQCDREKKLFTLNLQLLFIALTTLQNRFIVMLLNKKKPNSVADVWKNVLVNMSDFKELVPEFYDTSNGGDFLVNSYAIDFGYRHDGSKIGDVHLPPWASGPADFVQKLRDALESDWVSQNLHHWIDLIFGFKQRGSEAEKADNVFFHLCYEGAVDLDTIQDINDRHGLEVQIMEFGQIPKQVFTLPHPKRLISVPNPISNESLPSSRQSTAIGNENLPRRQTLQQSTVFPSHKEAISSVCLMNGGLGDDIASVGHDGVLKLYSVISGKSTRSVSLSSLPLSSCISYQTSTGRNIIVAGSWDNTLIFYDVEFGRVIDTLHGHEDAVSCLAWSPTRKIIISGSWDCSVKVWRSYHSGTKIKPAECLIAQLDHDSKVTAVDVSRNESLLVSGTEDGELFLWNTDTYDVMYTIKGHTARVNSARFDSESKNIISCARDMTITVFDVQTSTRIYSTSLDDEPMILNWNGTILLVGDTRGNLSLWDSQGAVFLSTLHCHEGTLTTIISTVDQKRVITGGVDKKIIVWNCQ